MLSDQDTRVSEPQGMQQEMQQLYANFGAQASYIEPEVLKLGSAAIEQFIGRRAAAEDRTPSTCATSSRRAAHTLTRCRREDPGRCRPAGGVGEQHLHASWRTPTSRIPTITLQRRRDGQGRSGRLQRAAHVAEPRRPASRDVGVLRRARRLQPDVRHDDELERAEGAVLRASRGSTRRTSRRRSTVRTFRCRSTCA